MNKPFQNGWSLSDFHSLYYDTCKDYKTNPNYMVHNIDSVTHTRAKVGVAFHHKARARLLLTPSIPRLSPSRLPSQKAALLPSPANNLTCLSLSSLLSLANPAPTSSFDHTFKPARNFSILAFSSSLNTSASSSFRLSLDAASIDMPRYEGSIRPPGMIDGKFAIAGCGRGCAAEDAIGVAREEYVEADGCNDGRDGGTPARGPVGIDVVPVFDAAAEGPVGIDGATVVVVLAELRDGEGVVTFLVSELLLVDISGIDGRECEILGERNVLASGRLCLSLPNEGLPPRMPYGAPRGAGLNPRGPAGGTIGPLFSVRTCAELEGPLGIVGAVKFRDGPLGGGLNPADGPRGGVFARGAGGDLAREGGDRARDGGDLAREGGDLARDGGDLARGGDLGATMRTGDLSLGVARAEFLSLSFSRSLNASPAGGDLSRSRSRSRSGDRAGGRASRSICCWVIRSLSGCICGEDRRDVLVEVLGDERSDLGGGEGLLRLQFVELCPGAALSSLRGGVRDRSLKFLVAGGGDRRGIGDLARGGARSLSNGDLDLLLNNSMSRFCKFRAGTNLSSLRGGDLARLSSSLRGENLRGGGLRVLGGLRARGGDRGRARQLSLIGERSLRGGVLDLLRGGERARSRPGCQLSMIGGVRALRGGVLSLSRSDLKVFAGGAPRGRYDSPAPIFVTSPSPL